MSCLSVVSVPKPNKYISSCILIVEIATCVVDASFLFIEKDFRHFLAVDVENSIRVWQEHLVPSSIKPELPTLLVFFRSTSHFMPANLHPFP